MLELITDHAQTRGTSNQSCSPTHGMLSKMQQTHSRFAPIGTGGHLVEDASNCFNARRGSRLRTRKACEQGNGSGTTRIGEDLAELWEEHTEQCLDLVFVACDLI